MLHASRCIGCGDCLAACPQALHRFDKDGTHRIDRAACIACGQCTAACTGALELCGRDMTVDEILAEVERDEAFYRNSGGGVTVSGGDPLMCPDFTLSLLKEAKARGLHNCIETSGYAQWEDVEALLPYVDIFLWDFKESDPARHKQFTGVDNARILANLEDLDRARARVILRCPIIPGYNDRPEHLLAIGALAERLDCIERVDIEPYHPLGKSKSDSLGQDYPLADLSFATDECVGEWIKTVSTATKKPVQKA
jgi:pyruvate formate lyase activating enzyme